MLPKDFRGYLDYLEKNGKLLRVKKEVDVKYEIAPGIRKIANTDGPALLFENIKGYPGWRVAGGLYATRKLMALALETEPNEQKLLQRYLDCDEKRVKPRLVSTGPVKEIIVKGDNVDLTKLPIPLYNEKDAGYAIIPAADIARHPETGIQNVTIGRRELLGKNRTALSAPPPRHLGLIITANEKKGQGTGVATVLGAPPELTIASQIRAPMGVDETEIAGALRGEPLEMVQCETIDVDVPAYAEVIIEGVTIPGERRTAGLWGELTGDYRTSRGDKGASHFMVNITAITMRKTPIFQAIDCGLPMTENNWLVKWALAAAAYRIITRLTPYPDDVKGINLTEGGGGVCLAVSIRKWNERTPLDIIHTVLSHDLAIKCVIVVDDDVNVYDPLDVERAWVTRVRPDKDIITLKGGVHADALPHRWGMDATALIADREWYTKAVPPGVDKVDCV